MRRLAHQVQLEVFLSVRITRILSALVCLGVTGVAALAEQPSRIHEHHISESEKFTLSGTVHPLTAKAGDQGPVDSSLTLPRISLHFQLTAAQQADLDSLLRNQQDRNSPQFHKWLTPQQYADRFGLSSSDMKKVVAWLESEGFTNIEPSPSRTFVSMSGNASQAQSVFEVALHRYLLNGESHFANTNEPRLPKALNGIVGGMRGLNDFRPKPRNVRARPRFTSSITGNHFLAPDDFATIYDLKTLYGSGLDGTGVTIAVVGQSDIALSDIEAFRSAAGLTANDPTVQLYGTDPGTDTSSAQEADLDLEWAGAVAPKASVIYVNSSDAFTSLEQAITNNLAPVISISYGECEAQQGGDVASLEPDLKQANAQGITVVAPSGDTGAADCDSPTDPNANPPTVASKGLAVDYPASSVYVTGVGGTELVDGGGTGATQYWAGTNNGNNGSAVSYIPEEAWNDTSLVGLLSASGGGASTLFTKPSWQTGTGVPSDGKRDVPDVALTASPEIDPALICDSGWCTNGFRDSAGDLDVIGGTSVSTPSFAGIVALIVQKTGTAQGNINSVLYPLAGFSSDAFHDITAGSNVVPCTAGTTDCPSGGSFGFSAGTGYDQVTGLGSVDGTKLVNEWPDFQFSLSSTAVTIDAGASANLTATVTRTQNYSGSVSFTCSSNVSSITCTAPGSISSSGSGTLTISRASSSSLWLIPHVLRGRPGFWFGLALMAVALSLAALWRRRAAWPVAGFAMVCLAGCGGGSSPTVSQTVTPTPTTATVTVTATTGGVWQQSSTVTVTLP